MDSNNLSKSKKSANSFQDINGGKTLILLENETQVEDFLLWFDELNGESQIIALTPFAMYELDKHGVDYNIPEDYYTPQELYKLVFGNFKTTEKLCDVIDNTIKQNCQDVAKYNVKPAMFSFSNLKFIYDALTIRTFQLTQIINVENPNLIITYDSPIYPFGEYASAPYLLYDRRESIYAQLLSLNGWNIRIKTLQLAPIYEGDNNEKNAPNSVAKIKNNLVPWLQKHPKLYDISFLIKKSRYRGLFNLLISKLMFSEEIPILLYGAGYNWDDSIEELQAKNIGPIYRISDDFNWINKSNKMNCHELDHAWTGLLDNEVFRDFFILNGLDVFPIIKKRFEYLVKRMTLTCLIANQETIEVIDKRNIKAVIASTFSTCVSHSVAQAAHISGIPVVTWQHGGYGAEKNHALIEYYDLINSDAHFVFGEGVRDSLIKSSKKHETRLIAIGSSSLDKIKCFDIIGNKHKIKTILYTTGSYMENNLPIAVYPPYSDNLYWQTQKTILNVLGKHSKHYSIIVKLHPSDNRTPPMEKYVTDKGFENFHFIRRESTFTDLLKLADVVVIDNPYTTMVQALTTKKHIFIYTGHVHFKTNAKQLFEKRGVCSQELTDFVQKLDAFLADGNYNPDLHNNEFIGAYGLNSQGSAAEKAARELKKIITNFN